MSLPTPQLPNAKGAFKLSSLHGSVYLPNSIDTSDEILTGETYQEVIPNRRGNFRVRPQHFVGRELEFSGVIQNGYVADKVKSIVGTGKVTVERNDLTITGDVAEFGIKEEISQSIWRFLLVLISPEPFWFSSSIAEDSSPTTVINHGDVDVFPTFIVTAGSGGLASINLDISGREAEWTGNASENDIITIKCNTLEATHEDANALDEMNDSFFINPPRLEPGENTVDATINGAATYKVVYSENYI